MTAPVEDRLDGQVSGAEDRARQIADHGAHAGSEERWMRPSKFTEEQIVQALRQVRAGTPAVQICRKLGITQTTFYRWRKKYERGVAGEWGEVRVLRDENQKLKQIVANLLLDKQGATENRGKKS